MEPYFPAYLFTVCQVAQLVSVSFDPIAGCTELVELSFTGFCPALSINPLKK